MYQDLYVTGLRLLRLNVIYGRTKNPAIWFYSYQFSWFFVCVIKIDNINNTKYQQV